MAGRCAPSSWRRSSKRTSAQDSTSRTWRGTLEAGQHHEHTHGQSRVQHPGLLGGRQVVCLSAITRTETANGPAADSSLAFVPTPGADVSCPRGDLCRPPPVSSPTLQHSATYLPRCSPWARFRQWREIGRLRVFSCGFSPLRGRWTSPLRLHWRQYTGLPSSWVRRIGSL